MTVYAGHASQFLHNAFSFKAKRQIRELYAFLIVFSLAWSLIMIFEPIFLYQLGIGVPLIALYYALHYFLYVVLMPLGGKFAAQYGYERSLSVSTPILIGYFLLLSKISPGDTALLWLAPGLLALHKIFYWPAYHANFSQYSSEGNRGTEQSWQRVIVYGIGVIGPLAGGFIVASFGFSALFVITALTLVVAGIPLLATKEKFVPRSLPYGDVWQLMRRKYARRMFLASWGWAEHLVHVVFWPIYLFIVIGRADWMGIVVAVSVAIMSAWGFVVGELSDRRTPRFVLRLASPLLSFTYILRMLSGVWWVALPADALGRIGNTTMEIPFIARLYREASRSRDVLTHVLAFEIVLAMAKCAMALVAGIVFWVLPMPLAFIAIFFLAGMAAWLYRLL